MDRSPKPQLHHESDPSRHCQQPHKLLATPVSSLASPSYCILTQKHDIIAGACSASFPQTGVITGKSTMGAHIMITAESFPLIPIVGKSICIIYRTVLWIWVNWVKLWENVSSKGMIVLGTARKSKSFGDGLKNADQPYGPTEPQNDTCLLKDFIQLNSFPPLPGIY